VPDTVPQLLTLLAVAKALCVSPHTVRAWVKKGRLRPMRICRRLLFDPDDVARFLTAAQTHPLPQCVAEGRPSDHLTIRGGQ
jgi:excisionase family DNA binding protein